MSNSRRCALWAVRVPVVLAVTASAFGGGYQLRDAQIVAAQGVAVGDRHSCAVTILRPVAGDCGAGTYVLYSGTLPRASACEGDFNGDGMVDGADLALILSSWGVCGDVCMEDLTGDGIVDGADLARLLSAWGPCGVL